MTDLTYKTRDGSIVTIADGTLFIERPSGRTEHVEIKNIVQVTVTRSIYDLPFLEKSVHFTISTGRKLKIKHLAKRKVDEIVATINL